MVKMRIRWVMLMMPNPVQRLLHHRSKPPLKLASPNPLLPVTPALVVLMWSYNNLDEEEKLKWNSDTHPIWSLVAMNMPEEGLPEIIMVLLFPLCISSFLWSIVVWWSLQVHLFLKSVPFFETSWNDDNDTCQNFRLQWHHQWDSRLRHQHSPRDPPEGPK